MTKKDETFLVIGSEQDSIECIEHLKSRNAVHRLCSDIVSCDEKEKKELFSCNDPRDNKYYVITSKDNEAVLMEMLVSLYNVPKERIIPFWKMFDIASQSMICDRIISDKTQAYDGIILGSSNSSCGFLEEKLDGNWCNMSAAYQDMYYIKCSLRHCINSAPDKFRNLKYAVIDLQDSFFFNYDVSVSKNIVDYLADGGYSMESHHFSRNKYFRCRFKELVQKVSDEKNNKIKKDVLTIWDKYFKDIEEKLTAEKSNITAGLEMMKEDSANGSINVPEHALTLSEKTVKENLSALCDTIDMLKKLSPDIKIYTTMIPHYMKTDQDMLSVIHQHVVYFRDILEKLKNMYGITHIDINSISDVSVERCCYKTPLLLNRLGAEMVTGVLRDTIMGKVLLGGL